MGVGTIPGVLGDALYERHVATPARNLGIIPAEGILINSDVVERCPSSLDVAVDKILSWL